MANDENSSMERAAVELLWDYLKRDPEHKDRRQTGWGTKTQSGLTACIARIAREHAEQPNGVYFKPANAGLQSEPRAAGRRIAKLLHALEDHINGYIGEGELPDELRAFKVRIIDRMRAQGWKVSRTAADRWQVLPPREGK